MKNIFLILLSIFLASCSKSEPPKAWIDLGIPLDGLVRVEEGTNENGFYGEYTGTSREDLIDLVSKRLKATGYTEVGKAFNDGVTGFVKDESRLAMKVDGGGNQLFLAVFNEKSKDSLMHGVVFGNYKVTEAISGDEAKQMLLKELEENETSQ
jgi:hypothetical protein